MMGRKREGEDVGYLLSVSVEKKREKGREKE